MALKRAVITGVTGQDGSYLAELLLQKGYEVHGIRRRSSSFNTGRIDHLIQDPHAEGCRFFLHYGDMTDFSSLKRTIQLVEPDEIYNLAAQSHVAVSLSSLNTPWSPTRLAPCECWKQSAVWAFRAKRGFIRHQRQRCLAKRRKFPRVRPRPFIRDRRMVLPSFMLIGLLRPIAKRTAFTPAVGFFSTMSRRYVAKHLLRARSSALLRAFSWALRTAFTSAISMPDGIGATPAITWKRCGSCCSRTSPEDYVIATGKQHSVRDFVCAVAQKLGIDLRWEGKGQDEAAFDVTTGERIVAIDPRYFRPAEVENLLGNAAKAREKLGWSPRTTFDELVTEMVREELEIAKMESSGKRQRPARLPLQRKADKE